MLLHILLPGMKTIRVGSVDGQDVAWMDVSQVRSMLRGRAGTTILLGLCTEVLDAAS
jgi:hypothetical protein